MRTSLPLFFALSLIFCNTLFAQQPASVSESSSKDKESYWKADVNYLTNSVYNGRKDTLPVPYTTPSIGYYHKSGLYAEASLSFLTSNYAFRPDMFIVDAGYNFDIGKNFSGSVSASKYAVNKQSVSVRSEIRGTTDVNAAYNIADIIKLNAGGSLLFNTGNSDILITGGMSHEFNWGEDNSWSMNPTVTANAGSQNYYDNYQKTRTLKTGKKIKNNQTQPGVITTTDVVSLHPKRFILLDYELSAPLYYDAKKWGVYFIPTYAIPQNPDTYSITTTQTRVFRTGTTTILSTKNSQTHEKIENSFYGQIGVYFVIK